MQNSLCKIMDEAEENANVSVIKPVAQTASTTAIVVDYANVCRLCMATSSTEQEATSVFAIHEDAIQFCHIAMALADVKVSSIASCNDWSNSFMFHSGYLKIEENDCLPKKLCNECRTHLIQFYAFKQKCEAIDQTLSRVFHTNDTRPRGEENCCIEMFSTLINDDHSDCDGGGTGASGECKERDMLASDHVEAGIGNAEFKCESKKKKKRKRVSKRLMDNALTTSRANAKEKTRKVCEQCGLTFSSNCTLRRHRITHTGQKDYICDICQNSFARKFHLDMHMRIHLKIRPHICETCASTFSTSSDLSRHRRIHVDVKNYACVVCERRFKRSSDVIKHMRSHTGQKPYVCEADACDKKYSSHSGLSKHLRRHHPQLVVQRVNEINEKRAKEQELIERKKFAIDTMCHNENDAEKVTTLPVSVP